VTAEPMSSFAERAGDLVALAEASRGAVTASEVPFLTQVDLRVAAEDAGHLALPRQPNTVLAASDRAALWLGPDEWLVTGAPGSASAIAMELAAALPGVPRSIVDVSANRAVLDVSGPAALEVLARGCSLDLHPRSWWAGLCAQTILGKTQVILDQRVSATRIYVRPSFAGYLVDWLTAAVATV
jgi:sarcosine oxidase, subunit gamma